MRPSGSNACDVMMRPSVSLLIFPVPVGRPAAISAFLQVYNCMYFTREKHGRFFSNNHATANVLHFSQPLKCWFFEEHHQLQAFRVKDLEAICKNLHLIIFQPCRQSRLHEAAELIKPQAVLFFGKKHHWESPMIPAPSNWRKCRTSCSSFPFPLLSTLSIAACTSFSVGFIPSRRMHFLCR